MNAGASTAHRGILTTHTVPSKRLYTLQVVLTEAGSFDFGSSTRGDELSSLRMTEKFTLQINR
jgi:hypothetical protein